MACRRLPQFEQWSVTMNMPRGRAGVENVSLGGTQHLVKPLYLVTRTCSSLNDLGKVKFAMSPSCLDKVQLKWIGKKVSRAQNVLGIWTVKQQFPLRVQRTIN